MSGWYKIEWVVCVVMAIAAVILLSWVVVKVGD